MRPVDRVRVPPFLTLSVCVVGGHRPKLSPSQTTIRTARTVTRLSPCFVGSRSAPGCSSTRSPTIWTISPSFHDGHQVQRIIEGAVESDLSGRSQVL